jgi:hypothetical protein
MLVEPGPGETRIALGDQRFVADEIGKPRPGRHVAFVGHHDIALDLRQARAQAFEKRNERQVEEQPAVLGMVDDIGQLIGEQPRIERVHDDAHAHEPVPDLGMAVGIPRHRPDHIAGADAEPAGRGAGEHPGTTVEVLIAVAMNRSLDGPRHHLARAEPGGMVEDGVNEERPVLHQSLHRPGSRIMLGPGCSLPHGRA